eukprot:jgi/Chlat1/8113/Chrsp75S07579
MEAARLAEAIVKEQLGEVASAACGALLRKGAGAGLALPVVAKEANLPPGQARNALLVLLQQNCAQAHRVGGGDTGQPAQLVYLACLDRILGRPRFPRYLRTAADLLGPQAEAVVEGLLEHGRLTLPQLTQRAAARDKPGAETSDATDKVKPALRQLLERRLVERAPPPELPFPSFTSKAAPVRGRSKTPDPATAAAEAAKTEARQRYAQIRFRQLDGLEDEPTSPPAKKRRIGAAAGAVTGSEAEVLWRVNTEEFDRILKHEACVEYVSSRFGGAAAALCSALLAQSRKFEAPVPEVMSLTWSLDLLVEAVQSGSGVVTHTRMTESQASALLRQMENDIDAPVVTTVDPIAPSFAVRIQGVLGRIRDNEVEAVVRGRFGTPACRIYRLLVRRRLLEQKQIAEMSMLPVKDARELLYRLLRERYLSLQEVARTADHAPARTFYLWRADASAACELATQQVHRTAYNVRERLHFELQQEQEVLDLLEAQAASATGVTITAAQRLQLERVRRVAAVLESSMLALDRQLMLLTAES